jgi:hypothetical protein
VKENWNSKVATPYNEWEAPQLSAYLKSKGHEVKKGTEANKNSLISQVKSIWTDNTDAASESYSSVKDWIFDRSSISPLNQGHLANITYAVGPIRSSKPIWTSTVFPLLNLASVIPY